MPGMARKTPLIRTLTTCSNCSSLAIAAWGRHLFSSVTQMTPLHLRSSAQLGSISKSKLYSKMKRELSFRFGAWNQDSFCLQRRHLWEKGGKRTQTEVRKKDTAGQERYRTITTAYYRGAMGFILMYDITNEESFNAVQDWSTQIKTYSWDNAQVILVGNKCDMEDERVISTERGQHLGEQLGFEFFETSAKDNINVKQTFERLVDIICDKMSESLETDPAITAAKQNTRLKETPPPPQPNCGC
uniref:small monomeric GTPase n=1 Tax=Bos taurus TaxID=9913 RepID=A0AAA9S8Z1_BOVIN